MADWIISAPVAQIYRSMSYENASNDVVMIEGVALESDGDRLTRVLKHPPPKRNVRMGGIE
jgi:hypothetical protein